MAYEDGQWVMFGVDEDDPCCLKSVDELIYYINEVGFLPLFRNDIQGFSVEERTVAKYWWSEDVSRDPWEWREIIAGSKKVAYGKFFDKRSGFVSLDWLPYFINYRRDGYDFDARWDDEKATYRQKKIMDLFANGEELFSFEAKHLAGFGKGGEKNFEGTVVSLQMQTYLVMRDFRQRLNKSRNPYGWRIAVYSTPEAVWGYDFVSSAYAESPQESKERIISHLLKTFPSATDEDVEKLIK